MSKKIEPLNNKKQKRKALDIIKYLEISILELAEKGKKYNWGERGKCSRCGGKLWGHGFRNCSFEGVKETIPCRRYICSECGMVIILRPKSHYNRFQTAIKDIIKILIYKITHQKWPPWSNICRAYYWFKNFIKRYLFDYGGNSETSQIEAIKLYEEKNIPFYSSSK